MPEHWNGKSLPSPGDLPNTGIEPRSPILQVDPLPTELFNTPKYVGSLPASSPHTWSVQAHPRDTQEEDMLTLFLVNCPGD